MGGLNPQLSPIGTESQHRGERHTAEHILHLIFVIVYCRLVEDGFTTLYALDLRTLVWCRPHPITATDYLDAPIRVADMDIKRAEERIITEKSQAISAGARGGITVEVIEAETVLNVCK